MYIRTFLILVAIYIYIPFRMRTHKSSRFAAIRQADSAYTDRASASEHLRSSFQELGGTIVTSEQ